MLPYHLPLFSSPVRGPHPSWGAGSSESFSWFRDPFTSMRLEHPLLSFQWHWVSKDASLRHQLIIYIPLFLLRGSEFFELYYMISSLINNERKLVRVLISLKESKWCRPCCSKDSFSGSYHNDPQYGYLRQSIYLTFLLATGMAQSLHPLHMDRLYIKPSTWRVSGPTGEPVVSDSRHIEPTVLSNMALASTWWILTRFHQSRNKWTHLPAALKSN